MDTRSLKLSDCGNKHCVPCQCHRLFKVVCKGHPHKAGHVTRSANKNGQEQKTVKKSKKVKSIYSSKYMLSLISLRTWVIAPDTKLTFR